MHSIAAKISKEIVVFLKNSYSNSGTREQESQYHPRRTTANDATRHDPKTRLLARW